jgi:hypothetical protein
MIRCQVCAAEHSLTAEFFRCNECGSTFHEQCRPRENVCPKCKGWISADHYIAPITPALDMAMIATAAATVILLGLSAVLLSMIPIREDAPGTTGVAFYFMFVPLASAGTLFACLTIMTWFLRKSRRRPMVSRPGGARP